MKIGIFDSGLGGLVITKSFKELMPEYDYIYYGDTRNLPYGDKDSAQILHYTIDAVKFLISQKCGLIIIACNTATAIALRYIQQKFTPSYAPDIKVLGVVIPTIEEALQNNTRHVGILATEATVNSHIYKEELQKINPNIEIKGEYVNTSTKILCLCTICGNEWLGTPRDLQTGHGCPECGRKRKGRRKNN
jgi:glutamate racemase